MTMSRVEFYPGLAQRITGIEEAMNEAPGA
jgi:hypothetical protein